MKKTIFSIIWFLCFFSNAQIVFSQTDPDLLTVYGSLKYLWYRENVWGIQEVSSDECFFPARGSDWYDGGAWVEQYNLSWTPAHHYITSTWYTLWNERDKAIGYIYNCGVPSGTEDSVITQNRAQAIFVRSFYDYYFMDIFGLIPVVDPYSSDPPEIKNRMEGFYYLIAEVKDILPKMLLREDAEYGIPTRDAALMLLAKLYLNKEVYTGMAGYDSCLLYIDELIATGNYDLADDYFDLFSVDNYKRYKTPDDEAILVVPLSDSVNMDLDEKIQWVKTTFHYNQNLGSTYSCWNGCCVPQSNVEQVWINGTDTATDSRWQDDRIYDDMGVVLGFNTGQQYDAGTGAALKNRQNDPLIFTIDCPLSGANENQGFRVLKYPPRVVPVNTNRTPNDYLIWRYADVLLMKAECEARLGNVTEAVTIVNELRTKRNAPVISAVSQEEILGKIITERGLELYYEGHRRQDLIRFGMYLGPKSNKENTSPETALICPIPDAVVQASCNYIPQNPGYGDSFIDNTKPTIVCPGNIVIESGTCTIDTATVELGYPIVSDNCSEIITITKNAPGYYIKGKNTITWSATDEVLNTSTCKQTVTIHCSTSVEETDYSLLSIYPNPANELITIESIEKVDLIVQFINVSGECVMEKRIGNQSNDIELSTLPKGIYIVKIVSTDWIVQKKLIRL
jgi:starch-binding outer membrane protein, SusD/RagB family